MSRFQALRDTQRERIGPLLPSNGGKVGRPCGDYRTARPEGQRKRCGAKGDCPPQLDREIYKRRNVIERSFNLLKQWRGPATRYDKHAVVYRAGAVLSAIITWLRTC